MTQFTPCDCWPTRRSFLKSASAFAVALPAFTVAAETASSDESDTIVGPRKGYSPQIGTLVSEMAFMRGQVLFSVKDMSQKDLDFLLDAKANTIGALLLHLAAIEAF